MCFMKQIIFSLIALTCLFLAACQNHRIKEAETVIPISLEKAANYHDIIKKIHITKLSDEMEAYMGRIEQTQVYKNYYLFKDDNEILYLFQKSGKFVSNSKNVMGKGKGEYDICLSYSYNPFNNYIEVVVPEGIIFYDTTFHFIKKVRFNDKDLNALMFNRISDIDANRHLLMTPLENKRGNAFYYIFDSQQDKLITKKPYPVECGYISMLQQCMSDDSFIAFPCMNYTFYKIDKDDYACHPFITYDLGSESLDEKDMAGKSTERIQEDLLNSNKALVLKTFKSGDTVVSLVKAGAKPADFKTVIANIKTKQYRVIKAKDKKEEFPRLDYFNNGIIYACLSADELERYIDKKLLDEPSTNTFASNSNKDNYCIVQYKLN